MSDSIEHLRISLPEQKNYEYAYGLAFKLAGEKLASLEDLEKQCRYCGADCQVTGTTRVIKVKYLNRNYRIKLPELTINADAGDESVELRDKILILHYLTMAKGTPLTSKQITYQELKEGAGYYPNFLKRTIKPLIEYFGHNPVLLGQYSTDLGGYKTNYGDLAVTIPAFERVPVTLVLWKGDDEFPPNGSILFDETILDYISVEDINILCQTIIWKLVKMIQPKTEK